MKKDAEAAQKFLLFMVLSIFLFMSFGCAKPKEKPKAEVKIGKGVMATVGDEAITEKDFEDEIKNLPPAYQSIANQNKKEFLNSLVNKKLLIAQAKKENLENSPDVKKFLEKAKDEFIVQQLLKEKILDKIKVSEAEAKAFYDANPDQFKEAEKFRASHILVKTEAEADAILKEIKSGADFGKLAKEKSEDKGSAERDGDIGYFSKGDLVPEFEEAVNNMKVGDISGIVKTPLGYHIIKLTDKKEASRKDFKSVEEDIKNRLLVDKQMKEYDTMIESLKKTKKVTINTDLLEEKNEADKNLEIVPQPGPGKIEPPAAPVVPQVSPENKKE